MNRRRGGFPAILMLVTSVWWPGTAQAQTSCDTTSSDFEDVYCDAKTFVKADDDLNVAYQRLIKRLTPQAQATLRQTQRTWVEQRNARSTATDSKLGPVIYLSTALDMTTKRINFLNDRYRECVSSGCQPNKLK